MRSVFIGFIALLMLLPAAPAFAQNLDAIVNAEKAVDAAWEQSPLRYRQAFFVTEVPTGFGMYQKRPDGPFKVGEKLIVYAEPAGYGWKDNGDGTSTFGFDIDLAVKSPDGKVLTSQQNFSHVALTSHARNHEFMLAITLDLTGADPGDYVLEYTTRDIASDKSAIISLPLQPRELSTATLHSGRMETPPEFAYVAPMTLHLSPFDAVVFDMDGTLLDTELVFRTIVFDVAGELGYEMTDAVHLAMVGSSHEASNRLLVEAYGATFPYAIFDEKCRAIMHDRLAETVPVKRGALDFLLDLRARSIPIAVATSSRSAHAFGHLGRAGLINLFDAIVTRDDVVHPKPHPEPYLTAARRLQAAPERCLALEDSHSGVRAAHAAGMQTIMVPDLVQPTDELAALCVAVLPSLADVHRFALPPLAARA